MTINYYSNADVISPNWQQICSGCGEYISRGQKSERFRVRLGERIYGVEIRHLHCRPDWVPKVKRKPQRDARGRFVSIYKGPQVGDVIGWDRLDELPRRSMVQGTANLVTYRHVRPGEWLGIDYDRHLAPWSENQVGRRRTPGDIQGEFKVLRVGAS